MVYTKFYQKERMRRAVKTEKWNQFAGKADRFAAALILVLALAFMLALTFCAFIKRQVRWSGIPISFRIFHSLL